eukprot:1161922-Pelagomonas_calceolata.AAC.3
MDFSTSLLHGISKVGIAQDCKQACHVQGDYLRGSLSRSLAEGAQSLWQSRAARAPASPSASSPRASLLPTRPATANLLRSSRAAPAGAMHGSNSPLNAADPEVEVLEAKPSPNAATSARKKSSAKQGSTQGSNGPRSRTQTSNAKPMRSSSGRAKREEGSGGGKGEGVGVDEGTGGNSASAGQTHGGAADGGASLSGNKKHGNATRAKGKSSSTVPRARPSTAPPKQAWKRGTAGVIITVVPPVGGTLLPAAVHKVFFGSNTVLECAEVHAAHGATLRVENIFVKDCPGDAALHVLLIAKEGTCRCLCSLSQPSDSAAHAFKNVLNHTKLCCAAPKGFFYPLNTSHAIPPVLMSAVEPPAQG